MNNTFEHDRPPYSVYSTSTILEAQAAHPVSTMISAESSGDGTRRRSSNRSIKRKKFDDELVEYSHVQQDVRHDRRHSNSRSRLSVSNSGTEHITAAGLSPFPATGGAPNAPTPTSANSTTAVSTQISAGNSPIGSAALPPVSMSTGTVIAGSNVTESKPSRKSLSKSVSSTASGKLPVSSSTITATTERTPGTSRSGRSRKSGGSHHPVVTGATSATIGAGGGRQQNQIATKDLGRWKPMDDLALIIGVQQTNDMRTVHLGTKFSCRFTVQELQARWYALLYDQAVSRIAVASMRNLHPDMIAAIQDRALWSSQEEELLCTINSQANPTLKEFGELLGANPDVFYPSRTASALHRHWNTMRQYHLLPDQVIHPLPSITRPIMTINEAEELIHDSELAEPGDEAVDREMHLQHRRNTREIRHLENELGRWNVLVDTVTSVCPGELDNQTLAVLRGRMVRYLMRSREITIGRTAKGHEVDVDLNLEGPAHKISRRQATLRLRNTGEFYLSVEGKRPIFIDGRPLTTGNKARLYDNSILEIASLRFIFSVNQDLIRVIHNESVNFNLPP